MPPVAPAPTLRRPSQPIEESVGWSATGHPHPHSAYQESVSGRSSCFASHDEAARKSMGEFSEYVKALPRSFATGYVADFLEEGEKASTSSSSSTAPQRAREERIENDSARGFRKDECRFRRKTVIVYKLW